MINMKVKSYDILIMRNSCASNLKFKSGISTIEEEVEFLKKEGYEILSINERKENGEKV